MTTPTGEQYEIRSGNKVAVVTEVGATLRSFTVDGHEVVRGFSENEMVHMGRGQQLLPWPNRIRDGVYTFAGEQHQLALSEPERHNAIHGLVRWVPWTLVSRSESSVTQQVRVYPQQGWPGIVEATITHSVDEAGLRVDVQASNLGTEPTPFGYAAHPYLTAGESTVDELAVRLPADRYLEVDERLLPIAIHPVDGTVFDLRAGDPLGQLNLDTAFTGLQADDGRWRVTLSLGQRTTTLWADEAYTWLQVFTGGDSRQMSVAVEPMTCGPDAFNEGPTADGVIVLAPGQSFAASWGIQG
ncbi:aldose 1-epimerase family protein [Microlunatus panaciterrae]|uniref:Aldose 1-epimerase n=1 Tax=Microlunatus panaciterrae TaxID=400768 RepID=A0ABS2RNJ8_9ACTN|nr:aldose 1-epimerase family protein [Microlunatus panaciterrae]MBM7800593.1 aldose 1-epimerase [Microlunatus panaciterrae]